MQMLYSCVGKAMSRIFYGLSSFPFTIGGKSSRYCMTYTQLNFSTIENDIGYSTSLDSNPSIFMHSHQT